MLWLVVFGAAAVLVQVPVTLAIFDLSVLVILWGLGLVTLRTTRAFVWTRYALTFGDAALIAGAVATLRGPLAPLLPDTGFAPALEGVVRAYLPPLLVFLALSGTLRIDPRPAALAGILAAGTYVYYGIRFEIPTSDWGILGLILVSAVLAVTMARVVRYITLRALEQEALEDYLPESVTRELALRGTLDRPGRLEEVTLLLTDMRDFTRISEDLPPAETVAFVNAYLEAVCPPIVASGGVIDKFMGDGVLAFFEGEGHARRALEAAESILRSVEGLGIADRRVRVGIALHSGIVLIGTIGPPARREYTIISDAVNIASRLEELNKTFGSTVVASDRTLSEVTPAERARFQGPHTVTLRGRAESILVHIRR